MKRRRTLAFAVTFWLAAVGFVVLDWTRAQPHDRFAEPPPWQFGQEKVEGAGHCAAPLK